MLDLRIVAPANNGIYIGWENMPVTIDIKGAQARAKQYFSGKPHKYYVQWSRLGGKEGKILDGKPSKDAQGNIGDWMVNVKINNGGIEQVPAPTLLYAMKKNNADVGKKQISWTDPDGNCPCPLVLQKSKSASPQLLGKDDRIKQFDGSIVWNFSGADSDASASDMDNHDFNDYGNIVENIDFVDEADDGDEADIDEDEEDIDLFYNEFGLNPNVSE